MKPEKYFSAIFDYDGTLTPECGNNELDPKLAKLLIELTYQRPFAICSARPFKFFRPVIDLLCEQSNDPETTRKNWYVVAENGATGHYWDAEAGDYQQHYHIEWPYAGNHINNLYQEIADQHQDNADYIDVNECTVIVRPKTFTGITLPEWQERNNLLLKEVMPIFQRHDPDQKLIVANSGIGFIILNKAADKDFGVQQFAHYLKAHHNLPVSENAAEIIAVGDRPNIGGNDEALLSGRFGTPYSVGDTNPENEFLQHIHDEHEEIVQAAAGTYIILDKHFR